jgi:DNA mismatch repair protein MutL
MSGRIRVLEDALADQIAAGEVVERPASVVKELIENAVDGEAKRVQVEIEGGGCTLIRVVDDGIGMCADDAALCLRRHATSKLRAISDLQAIRTLGFRGEALPSIASVSRFRLTTREREALSGIEAQVEAGAVAQLREVGCAPGTVIEVRDLFFNVPARLKFLKSRPTESGHVGSVCTRMALAHPELGITLSNEGRTTRQFLRAGSLLERAQAVFAGEALVAIGGEIGWLGISAALGAPERARSGALGLHLLVNGRPVRDPSLARAVAYAYGSVLPPGRYPIGALPLRVPADQVDVNVHPQKLEVRFRDSRDVFERVTRLVAKQLGTSAWSGPGRRGAGYWHERLQLAPAPERAPLHAELPAAAATEPDGWGLAAATLPDRPAGGVADDDRTRPHASGPSSAQQALAPAGFFSSLRVLGQVRRMLLICEGPDALYVIDQHAADERVCFDRLRRAYAAREVKLQQLLFPERVSCSDSEAALVALHAVALRQVGLDCSLLGPNTAAIHTVPALLQRAAPARLLRDMLSELERTGERAFSAAIDRALATMACHGSIRAGDALTNEEAEALLRKLDEVSDFANHCPHGRPILSSMRLDELERKLGR